MVFRSIFLIINSVLSVLIFQKGDYLITQISLLLLLIFQIYLLILKEKRSKQRIISYLESIIEDRSSISPVKNNSFYCQINETIEEIVEKFNISKIENQERTDLIDALLDHINIGLITFNQKGEVDLLNKTSRKLLSISYLNNITQCSQIRANDINSLLNFSKHINKSITLKNGENIYIESSNLHLVGNNIRIISLQNLNRAMDKKELDSWNTLIRSLNHEIMNSITPISSLAGSALSLLDSNSDRDLVDAVETIERRSKNLLSFVNNYKTLSQIPEPNKTIIPLNDFLEKIELLMKPYAKEKGADLKLDITEKQIKLFADSTQLEQIFINIIKNSIEANANLITLKCYTDTNSSIIISIKDDGDGFSKESENKAFIPFYTTKNDGSGLGLSIVRQILHLHDGNTDIETDSSGSKVSLIFP